MAALDVKVKRFIVQSLACWDTPTQVAQAVKEEFGVEITRQHVANYDPTKAAGRDLSKELKTLFAETRAKFKATIDDIPIANQAFRLRVIERLARQAEQQGNKALVAQLVEQAAKEVGGAYTNKRQIEGGDPSKPIHHAHRKAEDLTDDDLAAIAGSGGA